VVEWIRGAAADADLTMSVCTGAFHLARTGLLKGRAATTHHRFLDRFATEFPEVTVKRGVRFVEHPKVATAGGLSSGIDLALRVVERYFGRPVAERTATYMEYDSRGWIV
jgi:transcriptional regulator GlxA family with amidase domain